MTVYFVTNDDSKYLNMIGIDYELVKCKFSFKKGKPLQVTQKKLKQAVKMMTQTSCAESQTDSSKEKLENIENLPNMADCQSECQNSAIKENSVDYKPQKTSADKIHDTFIVEHTEIKVESVENFPPIYINDPKDLSIDEMVEIVSGKNRKVLISHLIGLHHDGKELIFKSSVDFTIGAFQPEETQFDLYHVLFYNGQRYSTLSDQMKESLCGRKNICEKLQKYLKNVLR